MTVFAEHFITELSNQQTFYNICMRLTLSNLPKTWIFDIDGTLLKHNSYRLPEGDELLPGVKSFFKKIPPHDKIILLSARTSSQRESLELFLLSNGIKYDYLLLDIPSGERILVNDKKPSGLLTAYSINKDRDSPLDIDLIIDSSL